MKLSYRKHWVLTAAILIAAAASGAEYTLSYTIGYLEKEAMDLLDSRPHSGIFTLQLPIASDGTVIDPRQTGVTGGIAWNPEGLILLIDIQDDDYQVSDSDDALWANDSVEIFLAPSVGGGAYYQLVLAVDKDNTLRSRFYDFRAAPTTVLSHVSSGTRTDTGYRIAARLPWSNLGIVPEPETEIGMQLFVNDAGPGRETRQLQWYPHAVSHNSERMHRLRLRQMTTDNHLVGCTVQPGYDYHRLDLFTRQAALAEFTVLDETGQKLAVGCFRPARQQGLRQAAVLLPSIGLERPAEIRFVSEDGMIGKAVITEPATLDDDTLKTLQNMTLIPKNRWGYLFEVGTQPVVQWSAPQVMRTVTGDDSADVRWFDRSLNEVRSFDRPGRYMAFAEAILPDGRHLRRAATFYAYPTGAHPWQDDTRLVLYNRSRPWWHPWRGEPHAAPDYIPGMGIHQSAWRRYQPMLRAWAGKAFFDVLETDPYGAVLLSFLHEANDYAPLPETIRTPEIVDQERHLALKRKILGIERRHTSLHAPAVLDADRAAPALVNGTAEAAGFKPGSETAIRRLCEQWYAASQEPFVVVLARNGTVFFHEAFGPVEVNTPMFMASVTKCMTGMLFAQFVDQGLLDIDQPVGDILPDFPSRGDKAITFRHCFTHTSGLRGHYEFGGMHNPWLENALALELDTLPVGRIHEYNGMGYDLAGKAMEIVGGKSAFRLMYDHLFEPLGMTDTVMDDMATCSYSTALDIARLGQLMLNRGRYGNRQFFSPGTFDRLLPTDLNTYYPSVQQNWGIGMTRMLQQRREPDASGRGRYMFSNHVVGHGAASSALFRVDPVNGLVIAQTRNRAGAEYDRYCLEFLELIDTLMEPKR